MNTAAFLAELGHSAVLRRLNGSNPATEVTVLAFVRDMRPRDLIEGSGLRQGDRIAIIGTAEIAVASWPAPPRAGDKLVVEDRVLNVQAVEIVRKGAAVERYNLMVRG